MPAWGKERYERGLLWRVSKDGKAVSYIFGTIHDADARVASLPAPAATAFARARTLLVEFLPDAGQRVDEAVDGGAGADADDAVGDDVLEGRAPDQRLQLVLGLRW